jgi:hypothetical protein
VLRSWTERARRGFASAGLVIGRDYVGFAHVAAAKTGWRARAVAEARVSAALFSDAPTPGASAALDEALAQFPEKLKRRYLPVHVSLPDAAVQVATFELEQLPRTPAAQIDLVRLRFARLGVSAAHVYACQPLEREGDKHLLFGMAGDAAWLKFVNDALARARIVPWSLSANACRQFNRFHDRLTQTSGALVVLAPDAWSLWLWDARGRPRHARSRWRLANESHSDIALEIERLIVAYVDGDPARGVERVYVLAGEEAGAMSGALDARLRERCVPLSTEGETAEAARGNVSAASSLAAALER